MANLTANYNVTISGYQGTVTMNDGEIRKTGLFCMADKNILETALRNMKNNNEIAEYNVEWVTITRQAG